MNQSAETQPDLKAAALIANITQLMDEAEQMLSDSTSQHAEGQIEQLRARGDDLQKRITEFFFPKRKADRRRRPARGSGHSYKALSVALHRSRRGRLARHDHQSPQFVGRTGTSKAKRWIVRSARGSSRWHPAIRRSESKPRAERTAHHKSTVSFRLEQLLEPKTFRIGFEPPDRRGMNEAADQA